jgi:hypothetical protein
MKLKKEMCSGNVGTHGGYEEWGENVRQKCGGKVKRKWKENFKNGS